MTEPPAESRPNVTVWPVFVAAAVLIAFGYWMAFAERPSNDQHASSLPDPFLVTSEPVEVTPLAEPVRLHYLPTKKRYHLDLRQERHRGDDEVLVRLATVVDEYPVDPDTPLAFHRVYDATELGIAAGGKSVGDSIRPDVAALIDASAHRFVMEPTGEVTSFELVDTEASQLKATTNLIREAMDLLLPRLPREPVRTGEEWSWQLPMSGGRLPDDDDSLLTDGKIELRASVSGRTPTGVTVELFLTGEHTGTLRQDDGVELAFRGKTTGTGLVVWNTAEGRPNSSDLQLTQTSEIAGESYETKFSMRLRGSTPE